MKYLLAFCLFANSAWAMNLYNLNVDFTDNVATVQPVLGVNRGVVEHRNGQFYDYSTLYQLMGITSVRNFGEAHFDVCHIYSAATLTLVGVPGAPTDCRSQQTTADGQIYLDWSEENSADTENRRHFPLTQGQNWKNLARQKLRKLGIEPYEFLGESIHGPNYVSTPENWGRVASQYVLHLSRLARPSFVEIWQAPDDIAWTGPNVGVSSDLEFGDFYRQAVEQLAGVSAIDDIPRGGSGFSTQGVVDFIHQVAATPSGIGSFMGNVLTQAGEANFDFISTQFDAQLATPLTGCESGPAPSCLAHYLEKLRWALDRHYGVIGLIPPPLHITQWRSGHNCSATSHYSEGGKNCNGLKTSNAVAQMLTLLLQPELNIERAFLANGLWHNELFGNANNEDSPEKFRLSPEAVGLYAFQGLENRLLPNTTMEKTNFPETEQVSVVEAAKRNWPLTGFAASDYPWAPPGTDYRSVVAINNSDQAGFVLLTLKGFNDDFLYDYTETRFEPQPDLGSFFEATGSGTENDPFVAHKNQLLDTWGKTIRVNVGQTQIFNDGVILMLVHMTPRGIYRIDYRRSK